MEDLVIKVYIDKTPSGTHIKILGNSYITGDSSLGFFEFITDFSKRIESVGFLLLGLFCIIVGVYLDLNYFFPGAIISFLGMAMIVYAMVPRNKRIGFLLLGLFFIIAGACLEYSFLGAIISFIGMAMLVYAVVPRKSERK